MPDDDTGNRPTANRAERCNASVPRALNPAVQVERVEAAGATERASAERVADWLTDPAAASVALGAYRALVAIRQALFTGQGEAERQA